jgi:hypothetical protein
LSLPGVGRARLVIGSVIFILNSVPPSALRRVIDSPELLANLVRIGLTLGNLKMG